jgi:hypothetical protein
LATSGRADEGEIVIGILQLGIVGVDLIDEKGNVFVVFVALD